MLEAARSDRINASVICPSGLIGPGDADPTPVGGLLLAIAHKRPLCLIDEGFWWSDVRDVANAVANAVAMSTGSGEVYFPAGRYAKIIELARLCSRSSGAWCDAPCHTPFSGCGGFALHSAICCDEKSTPYLYPK